MSGGYLYVAGIGAGSERQMTGDCRRAIENSDIIIGYSTYIELVRPVFPEKEYIDTPMCTEEDRCRKSLELADTGRRVTMVCSGDAGVYGMASLILELSVGFPGTKIEIIPGVTAACSGAAVLGAPLSHDFAVISLSDLLTPWQLIEKRLAAAAEGDFVICLYNPGSHKRKDHLQRACDIILRYKPPETVCGIVRNIGRAGENAEVLTLEKLHGTEVDMFTTVFIGNAQTLYIDGRMVTPRGYLDA